MALEVDMRFAKTVFTTAIILGAFITTISTAVYASSWDYQGGKDLYGLPHVAQVHMESNTTQLDFGSDGYGLPQVAIQHGKRAFDKADFSGDLYGLPYAGNFHMIKK